MRIRMGTVRMRGLTLFLLLTSVAGFAQSPVKTVPPQMFDVASVKPNLSGSGSVSAGTSRGRLTATNISVRTLILKAFHVQDFQVSGGPGWLGSERYDVVAKTENTSISDNDLWLLLQPLLAERFHLKFHRETKQLAVYSLTVAKGGPRLQPHAGNDEPTMRVSVGSGKARMEATNTSMAKLADSLSDHVDHIVIDRTGMKNGYDFKLEWAQEHPGEPAGASTLGTLQEQLGLTGPSVFTAVQEQLGLKLESGKGPVGMIVIDGVEKATAN